MTSAIRAGALRAAVRHSARPYGWLERVFDQEKSFEVGEPVSSLAVDEQLTEDQQFVFRSHPDWNLTTVRVDDLRQWLAARGLKPAYFFPQAQSNAADYLDPAHARYAPKLAASVLAWLAVDDPQGKSPKQALQKWLREHGAEFGLTDEEGRPNEQGIEECAKVANWQSGGGSPRTPGA